MSQLLPKGDGRLISGLLFLLIVAGVVGTQFIRLSEKMDLEPNRQQASLIETVRPPAPASQLEIASKEEVAKDNSKLKIQVLRASSGKGARAGDVLTVLYNGRLADGRVFASNQDKNHPFQFTLGQREVIAGWERGLLGARAGERRLLTIPPRLGYGRQGSFDGLVPPNTGVIFEIDILKIN